MAISLSVNGVGYSFPQQGDKGYAGQVTAWAQAITNGTLQLGGAYTLLADLDLSTFGIKAPYFTSKTANPATIGFLRLAKTDALKFRNNANNADLAGLALNAQDNLTANGIQLDGQTGVRVTLNTAQTGITTATIVKFDTIVNNDDSSYNSTTGVFTVPTGKGGWYFITSTLTTTQVTSAGQQQLSVFANGATTVAAVTSTGTVAVGTANNAMTISHIINLSAGNTLDIRISTSAGTLSTVAAVQSAICIKRLV